MARIIDERSGNERTRWNSPGIAVLMRTDNGMNGIRLNCDFPEIKCCIDTMGVNGHGKKKNDYIVTDPLSIGTEECDGECYWRILLKDINGCPVYIDIRSDDSITIGSFEWATVKEENWVDECGTYPTFYNPKTQQFEQAESRIFLKEILPCNCNFNNKE
jgi:hypothetical protein